MRILSGLGDYLQRVFQHKGRLFAYCVVLLIAIIFFLLPLAEQFKSAADVLRGLGTEFIGATLLFFLVDFFFVASDDEKDTVNLVVDERASISQVSTLMESVTELCAIGYSMDSFLRFQQESIIKGVRNGAKIRLILMNPDAPGQSKKAEYIESHRTSHYALQEIEEVLTNGAGSGTFEYVYRDTEPNASLMLIKAKKQGITLRVTHYPLTGPGHIGIKRLCLMGRKRDHPDWVEFYEEQFEKLWQKLNVPPNP
jgi:hypothetical protein